MTKQYFTLLTIFPLFLGMLFLPSIGIQTNYSAAQLEEVVVQKQDLLYTSEPLTQAQLEECETLYDDYTNLAENLFTQRYLYHKFVGNCVMLFDDPVWEIEGEDRYDLLSERLAELMEERLEKESERSKIFFIDLISVLELPTGAYLLTFKGCTGDQTIIASDILIASDTEVISIVKFAVQESQLSPETCRQIEVHIRADDPESIRVLISGALVAEYSEMDEKPDSELTMATPRSAGASEPQVVVRVVDLSHLDRPLTEKELKECENVYDDYVTLDEGAFSMRYLYHKFMGDCALLYHDPVWENDDDNRYEKLNQRLMDLREQKEEARGGQISMPTTMKPMTMAELQIKKTSFTELKITGKYVFTFEGCAGEEPVYLDYVMVASDKEVVPAFPPGVKGGSLAADTCLQLEVHILANDPNTITPAALGMEMKMEMSSAKMSPRAQMAQGTPTSEVICKEGLVLILKSSDGSAACVKASSAPKLIERGWGMPV